MLGLKVLVLGLLNPKDGVCSSSGVVGTLPPPGGIGMNIGSKLGLHWTIPFVGEVFGGNHIVGPLFKVCCAMAWL